MLKSGHARIAGRIAASHVLAVEFAMMIARPTTTGGAEEAGADGPLPVIIWTASPAIVERESGQSGSQFDGENTLRESGHSVQGKVIRLMV
jgi:hypothetical protein